MSSTESFHDKWKSFLIETKSNSESLSEIDAVGGIGSALKKFTGMGARPKDRSTGGRTSMKVKLVQDLVPQQTALVVKGVSALEKATSPEQVTAVMKSEFFTDLYKNNPDIYDIVVNTASKEKVDTVAQGVSDMMASGNLNGFKQLLNDLKIKKVSPVASIIDRITGAFTPSNRKMLLSFDTGALNEEDNKSSFNSNMIRRTSQVFDLMPLDYQKYIIATALSMFWNRVINENIYEVEEQEMMAVRAISKLQLDWIKENIDISDNVRTKNQTDLKKAASDPTVQKLLSGPTK